MEPLEGYVIPMGEILRTWADLRPLPQCSNRPCRPIPMDSNSNLQYHQTTCLNLLHKPKHQRPKVEKLPLGTVRLHPEWTLVALNRNNQQEVLRRLPNIQVAVLPCPWECIHKGRIMDNPWCSHVDQFPMVDNLPNTWVLLHPCTERKYTEHRTWRVEPRHPWDNDHPITGHRQGLPDQVDTMGIMKRWTHTAVEEVEMGEEVEEDDRMDGKFRKTAQGRIRGLS